MNEKRIKTQMREAKAVLKVFDDCDDVYRYRLHLRIDVKKRPQLARYARRYLRGKEDSEGAFLIEVRFWAPDDDEAAWLFSRFASEIYQRFPVSQHCSSPLYARRGMIA